jgi:hypothetical protein
VKIHSHFLKQLTLYLFLIPFLCIYYLGTAFAADYYVNLDAGSNGNGSLSSPWNNMDSARGRGPVNAGDTVYVWGSGSGQIFFNSSDSGASGAPITYKERPGYTASFKNDGSGTFAFIDSYTNYLTFDGFEVSYYDRGFRVTGITYDTSCTGITIRNCVIHDISGYAAVNSGYGSAISLLVENTEIYNCGNTEAEHGIYLVEGNGITIRGCKIHDNAGNNIQINCRSASSRRVTNLIIEKNLLYNAAKGGYNGYSGSGSGNGIILMDNDNDYSSGAITNAIVRNNIIHHNSDAGINFRSQSSKTNYIVNNTLWNNDDVGMEWSGAPAAHFINNISCDNRSAQITGNTSGTTSNNLTTSPEFESTTPENANFLKLSSGSTTALDLGNDQSSRVSDDFWGIIRSSGGVFDIGASEYEGTLLNNAGTEVNTVTNLRIVSSSDTQ